MDIEEIINHIESLREESNMLKHGEILAGNVVKEARWQGEVIMAYKILYYLKLNQ